MDEKLLRELLHRKEEEDWLEFKREFKLYQADGTLVDQKRDELIKDILGLANGNPHIIRKKKYLIIGAEDAQFDPQGMRILNNIDYKIPSRKEVFAWLAAACKPSISGLEYDEMVMDGKRLLVITVHPTFDIHETKRNLTAKGQFHPKTVFMRQDESTVPASVSEGVTIQQLKQLHRQEIANPSSVWVGAIAAGLVMVLFWDLVIETYIKSPILNAMVGRIIITAIGIMYGASTGLMLQLWHTTRYDWRFMTLFQKLVFIISILGIGSMVVWGFARK